MINILKYVKPIGVFYHVSFHDGYVIKTKRNNFGLLFWYIVFIKPDIQGLVSVLLHPKTILEKIHKKFMLEKIIAEHVPSSIIGNVVFTNTGYTQNRVSVFYEYGITDAEFFENFKKWVSKIHELWTYGYHEQSLNFEINSGFDKNGNCILFDFNEITDSYNQALVDIKSKKWYRQASFHKIRFIGHQGLRMRILDYIDQEFTEEKLNLFWNKNNS